MFRNFLNFVSDSFAKSRSTRRRVTQSDKAYAAAIESVEPRTMLSATAAVAQVAPKITTNPTNQSVTAGATATFTAAASGTPTPTVQWQVSTDHGATFKNITGATSTTLKITSTIAAENGAEYLAIFTNAKGTAKTTAATLTVLNAPAIVTNPTMQSVKAGAVAKFTASASGNPTPKVQWQVSTDGGKTFKNITGATTTTLNVTTIASENGNEYRAVFTNSKGSATTTAATLTVLTSPTVGTNPMTQSAKVGQMVTLTASATGNPMPTVQWQISTDGGKTFKNITGATKPSYSFTAASTNNGNEFRAVFTNSQGTVMTTAATLTVAGNVFDGNYTGSYTGTVTANKMSFPFTGQISATITNGNFTVTLPGIGGSVTGKLTNTDVFTFTTPVMVEGVSVTVSFTGSLKLNTDGSVTGTGTWKIVNSTIITGNGTWTTNRPKNAGA